MKMLPRHLALLSLALAAGRQVVRPPEPPPPAPPAPPPIQVPLATHEFQLDTEEDAVIGELQVTSAGREDTLSDIARRFNLGYEEIVRANPGVDPWLPGEGRQIVLPTQFVLPVDLAWKFTDAAVDETEGRKVTVRFVCEQPALELKSQWWARPGPGPVRHAMTIVNRSAEAVTLPLQASVHLVLSGPADAEFRSRCGRSTVTANVPTRWACISTP